MTSGISLLSLPDLHRRRYLAGKETKQLNLGQSFAKYWAMIFFLSPSHSNPIPAAPISRCKCTVEPKVCGQSGKGTKNVGGRRQKRLVPHYDICNVDVCLCVCVCGIFVSSLFKHQFLPKYPNFPMSGHQSLLSCAQCATFFFWWKQRWTALSVITPLLLSRDRWEGRRVCDCVR